MKLLEYIENYAIMKKKFAEKIGMHHVQFYEIVNGKQRVPEKYMKKIVKVTEGKVTLTDLMQQNIDLLERSDAQSKETQNS